MAFNFGNFNDEDIELIKRQLKSKEVSVCGIAKRCRYGFPQIIFLNPVKETRKGKQINYEAISNLMWLTCPFLNDRIHELENVSYIKIITKIIQKNILFVKMMSEAQANYYFIRNIIFRKHFNLIGKKETELFKNGIGGIRDVNSLKCLHLHFCHYSICKENIAGRFAHHLLGKVTDCGKGLCKPALP